MYHYFVGGPRNLQPNRHAVSGRAIFDIVGGRLDDSELMRVSRWLSPIFIAILVTIITITPFNSRAQLTPPLEPDFGQALKAVNDAEAAGATADETAPLVALLNQALELNSGASSLPTNQTNQREALLSNVTQILTNVIEQANHLTATSTQRAYANRIITYAAGLIVAIIGTVAYVFGVEFYQRYRIKRALMTVGPK